VYVRKELIASLEPAITGWMAFEGTDDFSRLTEYNPTFRADARRFEMITLPFQEFYGFTQSVELLLEIGIQEIAEVTRSLHEPIFKWADARGVRVASPRDDRHRSAIVCIAPEKAVEAFHAIKRASVVCSLREGAIRLSPHVYNTVGEMEKVVEVLEEVSKDR
jgi:selenocysteine lyase/cysteine desulfurase